MAKDKKSFVAYCDWLESFEELTDEEAGRLAKHLFRYVNDLNPEAPDKITKMCFIPIKQSLKRDLVKYEERAERARENGAKGGRPKTQKTQSVISEPKKPDSVNVSVNDNDISIGRDFDTFFESYGKQVDKIPCQREWLNIEREEHAKILQHVPKYVNSTPVVKFRKKPLNYLKDRTWLDPELPNHNKEPKVERYKPNLI
jgi:hypothetical protein